MKFINIDIIVLITSLNIIKFHESNFLNNLCQSKIKIYYHRFFILINSSNLIVYNIMQFIYLKIILINYFYQSLFDIINFKSVRKNK